jgi:hypothetical protein
MTTTKRTGNSCAMSAGESESQFVTIWKVAALADACGFGVCCADNQSIGL